MPSSGKVALTARFGASGLGATNARKGREVGAVAGFTQPLRDLGGPDVVDPVRAAGYLFDASDLEPLSTFDRPPILRRLHDRLDCSHVRPSGAAVPHQTLQAARLQIALIDCPSLQLASSAGRDRASDLDHSIVVTK